MIDNEKFSCSTIGVFAIGSRGPCPPLNCEIGYDTIEEINVDSKAEYTAQSSTRSQKLKQSSAPLIQYRLRSVKSVRKE